MHVLDPVPVETWQTTAEKCQWATYFHTPRWAAFIATVFPEFREGGIGFQLDDDTHVVLPSVVRRKKRVIKKKDEHKSMEPGVYGGFIAERLLSQEEINTLCAHLLARKNLAGRIVTSPFMPMQLTGSFSAKDMHTHVVTLGPEFDQIRKKFNRGQKSNINQARKKGVTVRRADHARDIDQYYSIYQETLERWGDKTTAEYPKNLFQQLFAMEDPGVSFWLAEAEGTAIAGILVLSWNNNMLYWHGCALQDYFKHYPNNLLHAEVMQWGCENGFQYYDMGASLDMEGVARFKESFSAHKSVFQSYRWK